MLLLRNLDAATLYLRLDEGKVVTLPATTRANGWYKNIRTKISALYVRHDKIFLKYDDNVLEVLGSFHAKLENISDEESIFVLSEGDTTIMKFRYFKTDSFRYPPPFDYIDTGDSDWGILLTDIINSAESRQVFIETNNTHV